MFYLYQAGGLIFPVTESGWIIQQRELVNLLLMSSAHNGLLLCLGKVQKPQQLRYLRWALLGASAVRTASGVTEKCAIPSAEEEDLELGQSLICSKNVHLCHHMFGYVGSFFLLSPTHSF